jgi:hypothetical protein
MDRLPAGYGSAGEALGRDLYFFAVGAGVLGV